MRSRGSLQSWKTGRQEGEEVTISGSLPAVLEVRGWAEGASLRLSDRKSSMEGLSRGRLSCCSPTSWRPETPELHHRVENMTDTLNSYDHNNRFINCY